MAPPPDGGGTPEELEHVVPLSPVVAEPAADPIVVAVPPEHGTTEWPPIVSKRKPDLRLWAGAALAGAALAFLVTFVVLWFVSDAFSTGLHRVAVQLEDPTRPDASLRGVEVTIFTPDVLSSVSDEDGLVALYPITTALAGTVVRARVTDSRGRYRAFESDIGLDVTRREPVRLALTPVDAGEDRGDESKPEVVVRRGDEGSKPPVEPPTDDGKGGTPPVEPIVKPVEPIPEDQKEKHEIVPCPDDVPKVLRAKIQAEFPNSGQSKKKKFTLTIEKNDFAIDVQDAANVANAPNARDALRPVVGEQIKTLREKANGKLPCQLTVDFYWEDGK